LVLIKLLVAVLRLAVNLILCADELQGDLHKHIQVQLDFVLWNRGHHVLLHLAHILHSNSIGSLDWELVWLKPNSLVINLLSYVLGHCLL